MTPRKHPLAECERCPLREGSNTFVPTEFAKGPTRVVAVGEAPGYQEGVSGRPFVGPSGQLLKAALKHHGINEEEVTFTNVTLCRPPHNATPSAAAVAACRGRLLSELATSGTTSVLALGATATGALVDDSRTITQLRVGPPKVPTRGLDGSSITRVIPTWHPAYCLRNADAFPSMVGDIGKLVEVDREPWSEPNYRATDDPAVALELINELRATTGPIVVDIEVGIEKDVAFDHPNNYDLLCVGLFHPTTGAIVLGSGALEDGRVRDALRELLGSRPLIAHNGKFDLAGLYPYIGVLELWFDTMLASYCLDERPGHHALKVLAVEKLGAPKYDEEILKYIPRRGNYADIPRPVLYKYNAFDVVCTWMLFDLFGPALDRANLRKVHDHLVQASNELMFLELNGIAIDIPYNFRLGGEFEEKILALEEKINGIVGSEINPRSPQQVKAYLETQGIRVGSTNVDTLTAVLERVDTSSPGAQFMFTLLEHRRQAKLNSTYVEGLRKRIYRGRVYTTYLLHGTTSGRLASRNPNLQNVVRDKSIKRQYVASKPSRILIQADYKNAELRVMADLSRDEYLHYIFTHPEIDLFDNLSDQIYGEGNWQKEIERVRIKAFVYGLSYGRGAPSIANEFAMPLADAYRLRDDFLGLVPGIVVWQASIKRQVLTSGQLVTPFGRRRRFPLITDQNKSEVLNEALSYLPQSTASDICLKALIRLRRMLKGLALIRLTIHDALVVECEDTKRDEVSEMLTSVMVECGAEFTDYVPFTVDVSYGKSWGDL